jgi:hypothetical protein
MKIVSIWRVKLPAPEFDNDGYYLQYDRTAKKFTYQSTTTLATENADIVGAMLAGNTETLLQ